MKKALAAGMALAMLVSAMTVSAGAVYSTGGNNINTANNAQNSATAGQIAGNGGTGVDGEQVGTADVTVNLKTGAPGDVTHVYAVSYDVTELTFTYGAAAGKIWNPVSLQYETTTGSSDHRWTISEQSITVTNYSDLKVKVDATVNLTRESGNITITPAPSSLELASAAPADMSGTGKEKSGTITFTATGDPIGVYETATPIGTITLKVHNNETTSP